jgi:hypothetical protein
LEEENYNDVVGMRTLRIGEVDAETETKWDSCKVDPDDNS